MKRKNIVNVKGLSELYPMLGGVSGIYKLIQRHPQFPRFGGGGCGVRLSFDADEVWAWIEGNLRGGGIKKQFVNVLAGTRWDKSAEPLNIMPAKAVRGLERRRAVAKAGKFGKTSCSEKANN